MDSQQILFEIVINTPTDYDLSTGIMDVNSRNTNQINNQGKPLNESYAYIMSECTSEFVKGKFTQQLNGTLLQRTTPTSAASDGRGGGGGLGGLLGSVVGGVTGAVKNLLNSTNVRSTGTGFGDEPDTYTTDSKGNTFKDGTLYRAAEVEEFPEDQPATPQPAAPPEAPTSSGDIDYNAGLAGDDTGAGVNTQPQLIAQDDA